MIVNRIDRRTGAHTGTMQLVGFGHGLSLGAVPVGTDTYLWTECGPLQVSVPPAKPIAFGKAVTRFKFDLDMPVLKADDARLRKFMPPGSEGTGPSYDPTTDMLTLMHVKGDMRYFTRYDATRAAEGDWTPVGATLSMPKKLDTPPVVPPPKSPLNEKLTFQGFQTLGDILYVYEWAPYAVVDHEYPGYTFLTSYTWSTGVRAEPVVVTSAPGLQHREPEGLAVEIDPATQEPRLLFGFSNTVPGTTSERDVTICWYPTEPAVDGVKVLADWEELDLAPGLTAGAERPRGRLIALAGTTYLQLRGTLSSMRGLSADSQIATLPHRLRPTVQVRHNVPRNNNAGRYICRVEANIRGELWVFGAYPDNAITWIDLDSFSAVWR
ncbi:MULTISPECIES: hypothetical protein [Streptomyces]|uniref:hypothetical protein n=1 Tax=Streptomyces TaxID=1883 RepID=UPI0019A664BB|nr:MULTISPECIES: hypothetical protein [Streptomyces]GGT93687.1 hypothetical protein GCM10010272_43260 [Streptomyces lateritius]